MCIFLFSKDSLGVKFNFLVNNFLILKFKDYFRGKEWKYLLYSYKMTNQNMDYLKKSLNKLKITRDYEEIDSRLASGWYVDIAGTKKIKKYKTSKVPFKITKKL